MMRSDTFLPLFCFLMTVFKKNGCFPSELNVLNFWKVKTCFVNKHKCTHTGYGRELWALLSMHKVQWLLSGTERKRWSIRREPTPPPPKKGIVYERTEFFCFFILLCSDLIREKLSRARRHGLCVPFLTLENSYFALCYDTGTHVRT